MEVTILYNNNIRPRMCCVQFSVTLIISASYKRKKADNETLMASNAKNNAPLILENVISTIPKNAQDGSSNLKCRPLKKNDVPLFMKNT
jgi:hypothetical protein